MLGFPPHPPTLSVQLEATGEGIPVMRITVVILLKEWSTDAQILFPSYFIPELYLSLRVPMGQWLRLILEAQMTDPLSQTRVTPSYIFQQPITTLHIPGSVQNKA